MALERIARVTRRYLRGVCGQWTTRPAKSDPRTLLTFQEN